MALQFEDVVIGTGQAGPSLAARLAGAGRRVAVIERGRFGGTCVNTGCIPTKTMVASAYAARLAARASEYGVETGPVRVDLGRVRARKDSVSAQSREGLEKWLGGLANCTVVHGHARFSGPREIAVGGERIAAERFFLNVGGRAAVPDLQGLETVDYLTNSSLMELDRAPARLVVVGGSYIGLEFGQMFRRFGSEVTIVEKGARLLPREDADVSQALREILENEGVSVRLNAGCIGFERVAGGVAVRVDCGGGAEKVHGDRILLAVGRRPNTDDLGLELAGVERDPRGYIKVDDQLRTSAEGVWALGDCNGRGAFTHTSYNDYEIVAANLLDGERRRVGDRIPAYALYTDPPLGRAGATEEEVRRSGTPALVGRRPMSRVGRAIEKGETQGFMKVLVDARTHAILGASILGVGGDEVVHSLLDAMYARAPYTVLRRAMHIHPTVSELLPTLLGELAPLAP